MGVEGFTSHFSAPRLGSLQDPILPSQIWEHVVTKGPILPSQIWEHVVTKGFGGFTLVAPPSLTSGMQNLSVIDTIYLIGSGVPHFFEDPGYVGEGSLGFLEDVFLQTLNPCHFLGGG